MATERDEVIAVLLFAGFAFLVLAVRHTRAFLMLPFGFALGLAILIKPTALLFALVLLPLRLQQALRARFQRPVF